MQTVDRAPTDAASAPRWLPPTQALARFSRPAAVPSGVASTYRADALARYGFVVASFGFLIGRGLDSEVFGACPIAAVPRTPAWLAGMMNLRGNPVPVFDLAAALDAQRDTPVARQPVLVLGKGGEAAGFLVDALPRAVAPGREIPVPAALPETLAPFVAGALASPDALWLEFDHRGFLRALSGD